MLAFLHLRQDLAAARQLRDVAISGLQFVQTRWEEAVQAKDNEAAEKWEEKVKRAEEKVETAEKKVDRAKVELDRASRRSTRPRRRPKQASRQDEGRPGLPRVQLLQRSRKVVVRFRAVQPFLLFGVMLSSQQGFRSLSRFHCVGLQHFGEWHVLRSSCALQVAVAFV